MPFNSWQEAEQRLGNPAPLTSEEIRDLFPLMNQVGETAMRRLVLQNLRALQDFERSSRKLTISLVVLTVILVVLTIVIARYTVVLAHKQSSVGQHQSTFQDSAKKTLGPWKAKFSIPGSTVLPDNNPIVKCSFANSPDAAFGFIGVTVTNLGGESYAVRYSIYGYNQSGRRISQGDDGFVIGKRETVLRRVFLNSEEKAFGKLGSVFWIQMALEQ